MPVSGFKVGDAVRTPSGNTGRVVWVTPIGGGSAYAKVRMATGAHSGTVRRFRQAALRPLNPHEN